jgi:hypothetical protein
MGEQLLPYFKRGVREPNRLATMVEGQGISVVEDIGGVSGGLNGRFEQLRGACIISRLKSPECRFVFHDAARGMSGSKAHTELPPYEAAIRPGKP